MMVLVTKAPTSLLPFWRPNLGVLVQPRVWFQIDDWAEQGGSWAMDNDAFNGFNEPRYLEMLEKHRHVKQGCLFVTLPDVVGDAETTLDLADEWIPILAEYNYPIALVGQDGLQPNHVPWREIDAFFVGGSTEWKLGRDAAHLIAKAKTEGKWVHMGRVNTLRRIKYAKSLGCDSIDGTATALYTNTYLRPFLEAAAAPPQLRFP